MWKWLDYLGVRHVSSKGVGTVTDTACDLCRSIQYTTRYNFREFKVVRCKGCGLLSVRVKGGDVDLKELYDEEYYKERVDYYFDNPITNPQEGVENQNILDFKTHRCLGIGIKSGIPTVLYHNHGCLVLSNTMLAHISLCLHRSSGQEIQSKHPFIKWLDAKIFN